MNKILFLIWMLGWPLINGLLNILIAKVAINAKIEKINIWLFLIVWIIVGYLLYK